MTRLAAWYVLRSGSPTPLREVDRVAEQRELEPRDRALLRRIVGTELRRRATLRAILHHVAPRGVSPELAAHAHIAFVQIFFLDKIPEHAVRSEASRAVHASLGPSKVKNVRELVDAALALLAPDHVGDPRCDIPLRNVHLKEPVFHDPKQHPLLWAEEALSLPAPLFKRWAARWGEERAIALARRALEEAPLSLRVVRGERDELARELAATEVRVREGVHERVLLAPADDVERVMSCAAFAEGRVTVQGESALRAAEAVQARAGEDVLDLCAAPGGKTAVIAQSGARVVACDISSEKLGRIAQTLERLRLAERVELARADEPDALAGRTFDAVLVDAPCSNTGVLAQRPDARWRYGPKAKNELVVLQTQLIDRGAALVRPGGRLVWSTCALEPDENRRAVDTFLARHPGWTLEHDAEAQPDPETNQLHGAGPIDGGYHARLRAPR